MLKYEKLYEEVQGLICKINELRERLHNVIQRKSELIDPEIIEISQELEQILNRYNELNKLCQ